VALAEGRVLYEFEDFLAFLEDRPEHERWELVEGTLHMMAPPAARHQVITSNLVSLLQNALRAKTSRLIAVPNLGIFAPSAATRTSAIPDIAIVERPLPEGGFTDRPIIVVEILSPSTRAFDLGWKKPFYLAIPGLAAYVVVETKRPDIVVFAPGKGARGRRVTGLDGTLDLDCLGLPLSLAAIYEDALG
jgi:Uma2 family endonuclease